ncbi:hypothetical protein C9I50_24665 [Pseudomonas prosekii]|uniref:hypothetical protein n=1 Tax=Pseudomonas prosekii TaxID=1148509 RepID=UPI000D60ABCF|nr:hypothetical protein [Pseudomonas prosekii]PWE37900.1 hypothetical protein C9I50_24665 [Pseudomonas prosekii]
MSEVIMRWKLKGFIPGVEGESKAVFQPVVVLAEDYDNAVRLFLDAAERCLAAERREQALQQRLNAADQRIDEMTSERESLIAYGRSNGLDEAATLCTRMAHDAYFPPGTRFKHFTPKAQEQLGNLLIKAANAIADLPDGPYARHCARQQQKAAKSATA